MVNEYDESVSRNICILLNLEEDGVLRYDAVDEQAISIAAGISQMLIACGINVSMLSNGCCLLYTSTKIKDTDKSVKTGDKSPIAALITMLGLSGLGIFASTKKKRV